MAEFVRVLSASELPDPGRTLVEVEGEMVALFHVADGWYALDDVCTHDGGPLADGDLRGHAIACPRHGARFDIRTGAALTMPAVRPTRSHEVRLEDGAVWVRLRDDVGGEASLGRGSAAPPLPATGGGPAATAPVAGEPCGDAMAAPASGPGDHVPADQATGLLERALSEEVVREMLRDVNDPELFVNIVDLGLVYGIDLCDAERSSQDEAMPQEGMPVSAAPGKRVGIAMTMTSPACPAGPQMIADAKRVVGRHPGVSGVEVKIVMDPPWTPDRMTEAARDRLGIF